MQIQCFESITQKYPQVPTALLANEEPIQNGEPFILYGTKLDITKLEKFQQKCGQNFQIFDVWMVAKNIIVLLKGQWFADFIKFAHDVEVDIAKLDFSPKLSQAGLLVMDMDSTAIQIECIDEIAKLAGVGELVSAITESAMRGGIRFRAKFALSSGYIKRCARKYLTAS